VLAGLLVLDRLAKVIVVSGQSDRQNALRAVLAGAYDFLCKPVDMDELKLVLQRAVYVAEGKRVTAGDLELPNDRNALPPRTLKETREHVERELVQDALRRHGGKITAAALELGISQPTLYELMEKLGIARE
jgi:DNA-binding NtrC family response regulator